MPRPQPTTLRARNRVTNKSRLKIHRGDIDFEPDDAPISLSNDTAGVDAEDANEHHLQAVLSAASQQNLGNNKKSTRGSTDKPTPASTAYIPTPDSTGVVEGFEEYYPPGKWTDPETYIRWSETVDDAVDNGLTGTFTYYMDERDQEWLEKNNEEARGEGTSAQGAASAATATPSRSGLSRSAKSKGKEPDVPQPFAITEDEFELVMGIFEKVTHDKTEFLHHSLDTGMAFPPFSDYQDTFAAPLPPALFATFTVPTWVPQPMQLSRLARAIYPHWRERRTERGGHRIIPILNGDETDTLNESYICFRRREIKAVRKTRASQVTSSDKLLRLQSELLSSLELAKNVLNRETLKREAAQQSQSVWDKRLILVDLKRKFPSLGVKEDEELLYDKERVSKRIKTDSVFPGKLPGLKIRTNGDASPQTPAEIAIAPRQRTATIQSQIEREMSRLKDRDHHWEDQIDNVYQPTPLPYPQRLYKHIVAAKASLPWSSRTDDEDDERPPPAVRIRRGRGGRYHIDRRLPASRLSFSKGSYPFAFRRRSSTTEDSGEEDGKEDEERLWRLSDRWKFDEDDGPAVGPDGSEEQDRILVDDYDPKYLRHFVTLLQDTDHQVLATDPSITVMGPDGRMQSILPYRLGMQMPMLRRDAQLGQRPNGMHFSPASSHMPNGTPISVQTQMKRMQPPVGVPQQQARISSGGGMRPPSTPVVASMSPNPVHSSPPQIIPPPPNTQQQQLLNGTSTQSPTRSEPEPVKLEVGSSNPIVPSQQHEPAAPLHVISMPPPSDVNSPGRPKSSQNHHLTVPMQNGYHVGTMNGFAAQNGQYTHHTNPQHNGQHIAHHNGLHNGQTTSLHSGAGLSQQQMASLKSAFANAQLQSGQDINAMHTNNSRGIQNQFMPHPPSNSHFNVPLSTGSNINLKLPPGRQAQWSAVPMPLQHNNSLSNASDTTMMSMSPSPGLSHAMPGQGQPMRTSSANGSRNGARVPSHMMGQPGQMGPMSMSPYHQGSPSPSHAQLQPTPPRPSPTPPMNMVSPSLQHQQMVGGGTQGY